MGNINTVQTINLSGSDANDNVGTDTLSWGGGYINVIDAYADAGGPYSVTVDLDGTQWGVGTFRINSDTNNGVTISSVTLTDNSDGDNDDAVNFDQIFINATTSTTLTFTKASFDRLEMWGSSNDTVSLGSGYYQWLNLGQGNDDVTIGSGGVSLLQTGDGVDTVTVTDGYSDNIETGDGDDEVIFTGGEVTHLLTDSGNDKVTFSGGFGATTVNLEDGNNELVLAFTDEDGGIDMLTAYDGDDVVTASGEGRVGFANLGEGKNVVDSKISFGTLLTGDGDDDVTIGAGGYVDVIRLSNGNNSLKVAGIGDNDGEFADVSSVEMNDGDDNVLIGDFANAGTLEVGEGTNTVTVDGDVGSISSWRGNNTIEVSGWVGNINLGTEQGVTKTNSITVNAGGGVNMVSLGQDTNNTIILNGGAGSIQSGEGDDTVTVSKDVYIDSINLSGGTNSVTIDGYGVNNGGGGVSTVRAYNSFTTINVAAGAYLESLSVGSNQSWVDANGGVGSTVNANGFIYTMIMGRANDTLNIGEEGVAFADMHRGDDLVTFADMADPTWGSLVYGGQGTDTADFSAISGGIKVSLATSEFSETDHGMFALSGFETLIGTGFNDTLIGAKSGASELQGGAGDDTYVVSRSATIVNEAGGSGEDTIKSSNISINLGYQNTKLNIENATLTGGASLNLGGNSLDNELVGNSGENVIDGRGGNDTLTGGAGKDTFVFSTTPNGTTNVDTITDYDPAKDRIHLDNAAFTAFAGTGRDNTWMYAVEFTANTSGDATTANHHVIYETDTGNLYYDSNGSGAGGKVLFANIGAGLTMTASEFYIV